MRSDDRELAGNLAVFLGDDHVGDLSVRPDGRSSFELLRSYRETYPRPVLGQRFEDDLASPYEARRGVPPFFSNLLPEERLRRLIAEQLDVSEVREAMLLAYLGEDLPGAVRIVPEGDLPSVSAITSLPSDPNLDHPIKFSLAGMQPKLSMLAEGDGMTFPATGEGGDWIVKMPSPTYRGVPENEAFTMTWARAAGVSVPEFKLVPISALRNLPPQMAQAEGQAFAVRRFDRPRPGVRVHIEDFAQILDVYPTRNGKYKSANYETIGRIIERLHQPSFEEFLRRLVFISMSANADAHVKNWSLQYPDRVHAELSPAYDLVSTIEFLPKDELALNLNGSKAWSDVRLESFTSLAKRIDVDPASVRTIAVAAVRATREAFEKVNSGASKSLLGLLAAHWASMPLATEA